MFIFTVSDIIQLAVLGVFVLAIVGLYTASFLVNLWYKVKKCLFKN